MIPNPFARPINAWMTVFVLVLVLHGLTAWAMMSMDSPERPEIKAIEPESIQLELVTLATSPAKKPRIEPKSELKSEPQLKPQPEKKAAEPVEKIKPALVPVEQPEPVEPLKPEPKKEQPDPIKETPKSEKEIKPSVSVQKLIIEESEKITEATVEKEQDLSAMIRAVTKQYNRDQARQRQAARKQADRKRAEQDRLQAQDGKLDEKEEQADASNEPVNFSVEQASWLHEHEPNTSVPLQVWRNTSARSGDVFTVLLELHVDKNGYITEVQLLQSSGNQLIDAVASIQVRAGQLNPFQQDGMPVNGIVTMPLRYERP